MDDRGFRIRQLAYRGGLPNVIAKELARGCSVVAPNCQGDTAELLGQGQWGRLVPVGTAQHIADAILAAFDDPNPTLGRMRAADFAQARVTAGDANVLFPYDSRNVDET